jgi:hypothetical protein
LRPGARGWFDRWQVIGTVLHFAAHLGPVVEKCSLHLCHHRPFDAVVRVTPMLGVLGVAAPFVGDADASGEPDPAIDH